MYVILGFIPTYNFYHIFSKNIFNQNTETDSFMDIEQILVFAKGKGRKWDGQGVWGWYMQTIKFRIDEQ